MKIIVYAIGLAMFFEGAPYLLIPGKSKDVAKVLSEMSDNAIRLIGGVLVLIGFLILYLI